MSTGYGVNSKGKDGKFHSLNLTSTYKGRSVDPPKPSTTVRHGLQSLGKVQNVRRVPPPASLPSLKSENLGNDPNIALVPKDGTGWASKPDPKPSASPAGVAGNQREGSSPQQQQGVSQSQESQHQRPARYTQQTQQSSYAAPNVSSTQQAVGERGGQQQTWGRFQQTQHSSHQSGGGQGHFTDDFPSLSNTKISQQEGDSDRSKEQRQYGPGPSLRPQNVESWREGGGRNVPQVESDEIRSKRTQDEEVSSQMMANNNDQLQGVNNGGQGAPRDMAPPGMAPGHMASMQYRGMMNQYPPYGRYPHMGVPPGGRFPQGMPPQGTMRYQQQQDPRYRGMYMNQGIRQRAPKPDAFGVPSIISPTELKELDHIGKDHDEGWAEMQGEVDYSEKLVFSDDEENGGGKGEKRRSTSNDKDQSYEQSRSKDGDRQMPPRQAWGPPQGGYMDPAMQGGWTQQHYYQQQGYPGPRPGQVPMNQRGKPFEGRMPPQGQAYPGAQPPRYMGPGGPMYTPKPHPNEADGSESGWNRPKDEKTIAAERAKRRREEEEKRMAYERQGADGKPEEYDRRYRPDKDVGDAQFGTEGEQGRYADMPQHGAMRPDEYRQFEGGRGHRTESESSDDRRKMEDGFYHRGMAPHPTGGSAPTGARNLPPRLAQKMQQQQEEMRWKESRGWLPNQQSFDPRQQQWGQQYPQQYGQAVHQERPRPQAIMKRERVESEGSHDGADNTRVRKPSESSTRSQHSGRATPADKENERPMDRRPAPIQSREFYRHGDGKEGRRRDNVVGEEAAPREHKLWEPKKTDDKRSAMKRQSSRESPAPNASTNDTKRNANAQKTLYTRSDSKPGVTKRGSSHSEKDGASGRGSETPTDGVGKPRGPRDQGPPTDPAKSRHEMSRSKIKLKDFRVEGDNADDYDPKNKKSQGSRKSGKGKNDGREKWNKDDSQRREPKTWSNKEQNKQPEKQEQKDDSSKLKSEQEKKPAEATASGKPSTPLVDAPREPRRETTSRQSSRNDDRRDRGSRQNDRRDDRRDDNRDRRDDRRRYETQRYDVRERLQQRKENKEKGDKKPDTGPRSQDSQKKSETKPAPGKATTEQSKAPEKPSTPVANKPTTIPALPPGTNIWEERKKKMQTEAEKSGTYIPTEEDKKRTLRETAPKAVEEPAKDDKAEAKKPSTSSQGDKPQSDRSETNKPREYDNKRPTSRQDSYNREPGRNGPPSRRPQSSRPARDRYSDRYYDDVRRPTGRGRGRSRGGPSYIRGSSTRGHPYQDRGTTSSARGRGARGARRPYRSASGRNGTSERPRNTSYKYERQRYNDNTTDSEDFESDDDDTIPSRKREVGERSSDMSYESSDDEKSRTKPAAAPKDAADGQPIRPRGGGPSNRGDRRDPRQQRDRPTGFIPRGRGSSAPFVARGEPSRRGRGRGFTASATRGRGRGIQGRGGGSAPPFQSRGGARSSDTGPQHPVYGSSIERDPKTAPVPSASRPARGASRGAANGNSRDHAATDRRKKTRVKQDRPPRFKRLGSGRSHEDERLPGPGGLVTNGPSSQENKDSPNNGTSESSPTSPLPPRIVDGSATTPTPLDGVHSSDIGAEEWETASDNSDYINAKQDTPEPPDQEQPIRRDVKPPSTRGGYQDRRGTDKRGRGRGGNADRGKGRNENSGNFVNNNAQVYALHSVDYTNQTAIDEALRDASGNVEDGPTKMSKKAKQNEELFKLYDLHNYASVVNVDDLPDVSHSLAETLNEQTDFLPIPLDQPGTASPDLMDDEGFTPVLSKKELRKREQQRKREEGEKVSRRAKEQQKQQQRQQRLFNKTPGSPISGASGTIKQPAESNKKGGNNIWSSSIGTWDPKESQVPMTTEAEVVTTLSQDTLKPENPSSQHDSGVESSVPSSQRSSPGSADPKVSFSTFGNVSTTTGVITSVCGGQVPSVIHLIQNPDLDSMKSNVAEFHPAAPIICDPNGSPRSVGSNPAGAIGGERGKRSVDNSVESKQIDSMSLEIIHSQQMDTSIHSLFNKVNDKNVISFVADNTDDDKPLVLQPKPTNPIQPVSSSLFKPPGEHKFPSSERNYTPFGEPPKSNDDGSIRPPFSAGIGSFNPSQSDTEVSLESKSFQQFRNPSPNHTPLTGDLPPQNIPEPPPLVGASPSRARLVTGHTNPQISGFHQMTLQSISQTAIGKSSVLDSIKTQNPIDNPGGDDLMLRNGLGSNPEVPSDMTDSEQNPGSTIAGVPGPIPMPPKHQGNPNPGGGDNAAMGQNPTGNDLVLRGQGVTGGDLGMRGQSGPGGDLGLRGQSSASGEIGLRSQGPAAGDMDLRGQSSTGNDISLLTPTSPSVDFNLKMESARKAWENTGQAGLGNNPVTFSSFHPSSVSSSNISQTIDTSTVADVQTTFNVAQSREWKPTRNTPPVGVGVEQSSSTEPNPGAMKVSATSVTAGTGVYHPESHVTSRPMSAMVQQQQQSQIVSPVISPYQLLTDPQPFTPSSHRVVQQASTQYQPISSTSLHNNLQQMQQAMFNQLPGALQNEYSLIGSHGYSGLSHHPLTYNAHPLRDYQTSLFLQAQTTVVTQPVKAPPLNTVALKPQSHALNSRTAAYGAAPGPSINLNLAHRSASSAGSNLSPVTAPVYLPAFSATQRQHSTSFYSQLNQTPGYYATQAQPTNQQQPRQATYQQQQQTHGVQYQPVIQQMNKAPSPSPLSQSSHDTAMGTSGTNMMGASHSALGIIGAGHGGSYAVAPPTNARVRGDTDFTQSQMYMPSSFPPKNTNFPPKQPSSQPQDISQMGVGMKMSPYHNPSYMMGQKPQVSQPTSATYGAQKPPTPVNQGNLTPTSQGGMKYPPFSQNQKTFAAVDQQMTTDRVKQGMSLQFRQSQVQGILSRPYSGDPMNPSAPPSSTYMPSRTPDGSQMPPQPTGQMLPPFNSMQPRFPSNQWGGPMQGSAKPPQQMGPNMGMVRPPMDMMGKPQRMPMNPQQRYMPPQQFQQHISPQQMAAAARTGMPFRPPRMQQPNQQMNPPFGEFHAKPPMQMNQQNVGPPPASMPGQPAKNKIPPIPSLVCGVQKGLDASGKKAQYIPIEKVKEQQTEGRMSLLSSISSFFKDDGGKSRDESEPDPRKMSDDAFAAGRPRPGRRSRSSKNAGKSIKMFGTYDAPATTAMTSTGAVTGMMGTMVIVDAPEAPMAPSVPQPESDEPLPSGVSKRSGPIGGPSATKKPGKSDEPPKDPPVVKKMTLADTRPKKGEIVRIPLKETL